MKIIHLSDLHLGKRVNEFSMIEDQKHILSQIISIIKNEMPDCVLIAGDIYDKSVPHIEAVSLFDDFLVSLFRCGTKIFVISGNHDSQERVAFGSRIINKSGVFLSPVYDGHINPVTLNDEHGLVQIYLLPFLKPSQVRMYYPDEDIKSYTDAMRVAVESMNTDISHRNILVTHQFVTNAVRCDSEEISVGGSDNVDASVFHSFDYTALGHIHTPQNIGDERIRYCGSPLKYSFSEANRDKSVTVVELLQKGDTSVRTIPLNPLHDMREIRGTYMEITLRSFYQNTTYQNDYLHITLTDEDDIPDAIGKLRVIYPYIMKLDYDNIRTRSGAEMLDVSETEQKTSAELFSELYEKQNNQPMSEEQQKYISSLIEKIWEDME